MIKKGGRGMKNGWKMSSDGVEKLCPAAGAAARNVAKMEAILEDC